MNNQLIALLMILLLGYLLLRRQGSDRPRQPLTGLFYWMARRELSNPEAPQVEDGYETKKRKLLIALRRKISEKNTKVE